MKQNTTYWDSEDISVLIARHSEQGFITEVMQELGKRLPDHLQQLEVTTTVISTQEVRCELKEALAYIAHLQQVKGDKRWGVHHFQWKPSKNQITVAELINQLREPLKDMFTFRMREYGSEVVLVIPYVLSVPKQSIDRLTEGPSKLGKGLVHWLLGWAKIIL